MLDKCYKLLDKIPFSPHLLLSKLPLIGWNLKVAAPVPLVQSRQPFGGHHPAGQMRQTMVGGRGGGGRREEEEDEPNQSAGTINLITTNRHSQATVQ
jgi:hypothetical protein